MGAPGDGRVALVSSHPTPQVAAGELLGAAFEAVGPAPDLVIVAAAGGHRRHLETLVGAAGDLLAPGVLVGVGTAGLASPLAVTADGFGILALGGASVDARPVSFHDDGRVVTGLPSLLGEPVVTVLGDAATCSLPAIVREVHAGAPGTVVAGGLLARDPDTGAGAELWLDGERLSQGALVLSAPRSTPVGAAQGLRPVGPPRVVTALDGGLVVELDGRPAAEVVTADLAAAEPRPRGTDHLVLALVADEVSGAGAASIGPASIGPATPVLGVQRARRAVAVGGDAATATAVPPWLRIGARVRLAEDHPAWLRDDVARRLPCPSPVALAVGDADGLAALGVVGDVVDEVLGLRATSVVGPARPRGRPPGAEVVADGGARLVVVGLAGPTEPAGPG